MAVWPPDLNDLKHERKIDVGDARDDDQLSTDLAAAIAYVERVRSDVDFTEAVSDDLVKGTLMLASRLFTRRKSPDGVVPMGDLGSGNVPAYDADIERLLRVGRYAPMRFA